MTDTDTIEDLGNEPNTDQLQLIINEMTDRIIKVAELVDKAFPEKQAAAGIKACADQLRSHVNTLSAQALKAKYAKTVKVSTASLVEMAKKECSESFKLLSTFIGTDSATLDYKVFEIVSNHARDLFKTLVSEETCVQTGGDFDDGLE